MEKIRSEPITTKEYAGFKIVVPEKPQNAIVLWRLGMDVKTQAISERLNYRPSDQEIDFITSAANRQEESLKRLTQVSGRTALFDSPEFAHLSFAGVPFDTLEIGGFGRQRFIETKTPHVISLDKFAPINMPSEENFASLFPDIAQTEVVTNTGFRTLGKDFSFYGAYTEPKAIYKVAANLYLLSKLLEKDSPLLLVPIPIALGIYPQLKDPEQKPAYFIAWRAPYQGKRIGIFSLQKTYSLNDCVSAIVRAFPILQPVRHFLHDELGLTHNQLVTGNYYVPEKINCVSPPPLLADFSTIWPISSRNFARSRAIEVARVIYGTWSMANLFTNNTSPEAETDFLKIFYDRALVKYLGFARFDIPRKLSDALDTLTAEISAASSEPIPPPPVKRIPKSTPAEYSINQIREITGFLRQAVQSRT